MSTFTYTNPYGEDLRSEIAPPNTAPAFAKRPFGFGSRSLATAEASVSISKPMPARFAHSVTFSQVEADLDRLIANAIDAIVEGEPVEDEILGHYVQIASLVRAVSFREGKLLEYAVARLARANPAITVLTQSIRLPLVKAALEAVSGNDWTSAYFVKTGQLFQ